MPDNGYVCNTELVSHEGNAGGFKVERFVDKAGRQCAYYDTTLLFPVQAIQQLRDQATGVAVVDMTDPANPIRTATLATPAMQTPHESLLLSEKRGLLVAVMGNPAFAPGVVDVYDLNEDCRYPVLRSSLPVGLLGHESGLAPDGRTFYATSLFNGNVTAVDLTDPTLPVPLGVYEYPSHTVSLCRRTATAAMWLPSTRAWSSSTRARSRRVSPTRRCRRSAGSTGRTGASRRSTSR